MPKGVSAAIIIHSGSKALRLMAAFRWRGGCTVVNYSEAAFRQPRSRIFTLLPQQEIE